MPVGPTSTARPPNITIYNSNTAILSAPSSSTQNDASNVVVAPPGSSSCELGPRSSVIGSAAGRASALQPVRATPFSGAVAGSGTTAGANLSSSITTTPAPPTITNASTTYNHPPPPPPQGSSSSSSTTTTTTTTAAAAMLVKRPVTAVSPDASPHNLNPNESPVQQQLRQNTTTTNNNNTGGGISGNSNIPYKVLLRNLTLFVILKVLGSFDSGAFSATLNGDNGITEDWGLTVSQQGTLSSSVFLGNMIGCAIAGHLFSIYSAKMLLIASLIIHGFFTFLFASAESYEFALLCRFFIGVTLAFIVVYTPVWVDGFAPKHVAATWMALQNAGVPLGIMLGFVIGGLMPTYTSVSWEWAFYLKTIVMVPIIAMVAKTDSRSLDSPHIIAGAGVPNTAAVAVAAQHQEYDDDDAKESSSSNHPPSNGSSNRSQQHHQRHLNHNYDSMNPAAAVTDTFAVVAREAWARLVYVTTKLGKNGVYVSNMLSLSSLYFVVSGLQTFITSYLRADPFNASMETIVIGFGCAVVTAPVFGVIAGGVLLDRIGGYHGNILRASKFGLLWGVLAAIIAVICIFIEDTQTFLVVVWLLLFCGGAIIPPGSGINMACLPEALRPSGSSVAQMAFNLLGNFSGPLMCGWIAEWTGSLTWGVRAVFFMGVIGVIPMIACTYFAARRTRKMSTIPTNPPTGVVAVTINDATDDDMPPSSSTKTLGTASGPHHRVAFCYASNMSIIAALEETVETSEIVESPRNTEEETELQELNEKRSASLRRFAESTTALGGGGGVGAASVNSVKATAMRGPSTTEQQQQQQQQDAAAASVAPVAGAAAVAAGGGTTVKTVSPLTPMMRSSSSTIKSGRASIAKKGGANSHEDDETVNSSVVLDSQTFNLSFPSQHVFGLDVVRGIIDGGGSPAPRAPQQQQQQQSVGRGSLNGSMHSEETTTTLPVSQTNSASP